ncbi:beta-glucoside-specific PTS transporter subunit IIABC [Caldibacillus lycopersici]|uniref:Beta-glucoside-specific PTS transporter subunit IIABC n=1 Tax=Perspicuibacillus lycopersici TaxID=1325689 RepID=A0AAE3IUI1_9BACI|nr:beta-glucoside-specific PTS transporter subunit IIABC [Perspicuibacillus lycopersici]MCU9613079.1 beta-glucoside-specific PTS transporter subunit IIABC [Perspicuibacillus lycopersici]
MANRMELAKLIIENVGGEENVASLYHCMTRLRFKLKDGKSFNKQELENIRGVVKAVESNGQYQVVIGNDVGDVYQAIMKQYAIKSASNGEQKQKKEGNVIARLFNIMSSIITPMVPLLAGSGMLKALLVICTTYFGMSATGSTYLILSAASNAVFFFFPIFLAFSAARTFGTNLFVSAAIMAALLEPNFTGLMKDIGDVVDFLGIPIVMFKYSGQIIPAILAIWLFSYLEKFLKRWIPKVIESFAVPMLSLLIMVPLTAGIIGPVGVYLGNGIADGIDFLNNQSGMLTGAIIGAGWTFLVMFGIHWGVVPAMLNNLSTKGFDTIRPPVANATFAQAGVAFGVFLKAKDKQLKSDALASMMPAILAGITEPIVYGLSVKYKRPMIAAVIGGGIGGAFAGAMKTTVIAYVFPALTTLPAFMTNTFVYYIISITVAFVVTAVLTYILGFDEDIKSPIKEEKAQKMTDVKRLTVLSPISGDIVPLQQVKDPVFATEAMGKGIAILPKEGKVFAPVSGEVSTLFPTGHAIGLTSEEQIEVLIHIGLDTVQLEGKYFKAHVKPGEKVKQGQLLVEFDMEKIKAAGYDVTTPIIITNSDQYSDIIETNQQTTTKQEVLLTAVIL